MSLEDFPRSGVPGRGPRVPAVLVGRWGGESQGDVRVIWRKVHRQEGVKEWKLVGGYLSFKEA